MRLGRTSKILAISSFLVVLALLFIFVIFFSSFNLSRKEEIRREDDVLSYLSFPEPQRFEVSDYECTGHCYCDDAGYEMMDEYRRTTTTATVGKRSLVYFLSAISGMKAYKLAKDYFPDKCAESFEGNCNSITSEIDYCEIMTDDTSYMSMASEGDDCNCKDYLDEIKRHNFRTGRPDKKKTALIVVDMQETYKDMTKDIMPNVLEVIGASYDAGLKIIFTRFGLKPGEGKVLRVWWKKGLPDYKSTGWELSQEMKGVIEDKLHDDCHIVDKNVYSAFHDTDLDEYLKENDIEEVIIVGVYTNCCCASTARGAFDLGYKNYVVSDATAGTSEDRHVDQLKILSFSTSYVLSTEQLIEYLRSQDD